MYLENINSSAYTYDNVGNIVSAARGSQTTTYEYDSMGQLTRVNDPAENATWLYAYDCGGNMTSKVKYAYTTGALGTPLLTIPYLYSDANWKDKLTSYNGVSITYDAIGNPLNDGTWNYQWEQGRRLWQMNKGEEGQSGNVFVDFAYNADGLRINKQVLSYDSDGNDSIVNTDYTLHGKNIVHMTRESDTMHFWYDAQNRPAIVNYNGTKYAYILNLQGDVVGIQNSAGTEVVRYTYDSWGKPISTTGTMAATLGFINPFRYRGYVYDEETGLYYLRSRYYNPEWNRFVNADSVVVRNCFAYCSDSPVSNVDITGNTEMRTSITDDQFNETVTQGMRNLLYNASDYYYISKSKNDDGGIDCIWAVNKALGKIIAKKVDAAWYYYAKKRQKRGKITDYEDLQPGDIVFSIDSRDKNYSTDINKIGKIDNIRKGHIGIVVLFDFGDGNGEVLAVFQSCSVELNETDWTALYYGDTGPNITALADKNGKSNWRFYIRLGGK